MARIRGVPEEGVADDDKGVVLPTDFGKEAQVSFLDQDSDAEMEAVDMEDLDDVPNEEEKEDAPPKKKKPAKGKGKPKDDEETSHKSDDEDDDEEHEIDDEEHEME